MRGYLGEILAIIVLVILQGYFVAAEIALVSARRSALQTAAENGSRGARRAMRLLDDPTRLLSTISAAITLIGFTAASLAAVTFEGPVAAWLRSIGFVPVERFATGLAVFFVTLVVTYVNLVFAELAPKRLGLQRAEKVAAAVAGPVNWLSVALGPVVWVLSRSTDVVARMLGVRPGGKPGVSEEEIKLLVTEQGNLLDEEKRMIHEVLELGDTVAREIMVPRVDMEMLEGTLTVIEALVHFQRTGFSRMPVYRDDPDTVIGVALLKDIVEPIAAGRTADALTEHARDPVFVPETKPILGLLSDMRTSHNHMVVVVDEHGGTAGLVTIEDIVEEVVGEIADEYDREHRYITEAGDGRWVVDGRVSVEEARERLGLEVPESDEYETVAGWVLMELGHIPQPGETVSVHGDTFRVLSVRRRRIAQLLVEQGEESARDETEG